MIELGVKQKLYIDHKTDFGVYLSDTPERNGKSDCVLLPKKQVPQNAKIGDEVEVINPPMLFTCATCKTASSPN